MSMPTVYREDVPTVAIVALLLIAIGFAAGWYLFRPDPVIETPAAQVIQADGSKIIERLATDPKARPPHQVPKGAKVERIVSVTLEPTGKGITLPTGEVKCPPVTLDLSLDRMPDGTRRVITSSPDAEITRAFDIPVETLALPESRPWAVGIAGAVNGGALWATRDVGRFRAIVIHSVTNPRPGMVDQTTFAGVGYSF